MKTSDSFAWSSLAIIFFLSWIIFWAAPITPNEASVGWWFWVRFVATLQVAVCPIFVFAFTVKVGLPWLWKQHIETCQWLVDHDVPQGKVGNWITRVSLRCQKFCSKDY